MQTKITRRKIIIKDLFKILISLKKIIQQKKGINKNRINMIESWNEFILLQEKKLINIRLNQKIIEA